MLNHDGWNHKFQLLKTFKETHGADVEPTTDPCLRNFCLRMRRRANKGKLSKEKMEQLDSIGFFQYDIPAVSSSSSNNNNNNNKNWFQMLEKLKAYKEAHGNCNVPLPFQYKQDRALARWVKRQRARKAQMNPKRVHLLDDIGFNWNVVQDRPAHGGGGWEKKFALLAEFKGTHGTCNVPADHPVLGQWVRHLRVRHTVMQKLCPRKVTQLNALDFNWDGPKDAMANGGGSAAGWQKKFALLAEYKATHGTCHVPADHPVLGQWVRRQRARHAMMQKRCPRKVTQLDSLGFDWNGDAVVQSGWETNYGRLLEYKKEHGHCNVPEDHPQLGRWVKRKRAQYDQFQKNHPGKVELLNQLGFHWTVSTTAAPAVDDDKNVPSQWMENLKKLRDYKVENGDCNVPPPRQYRQDPSFARWVKHQRMGHGRMQRNNPRKVELLETIGLEWERPNTDNNNWKNKFNSLKQYKEEHGTCNVPEDHPELGQWTKRQRAKYEHMKNNCPGKVNQLNELGFDWDGPKKDEDWEVVVPKNEKVVVLDNKGWMKKFDLLCKFKEKRGHCNVPNGNPRLGHWVKRQRAQYEHMLTHHPERVELLTELGFAWSPPPIAGIETDISRMQVSG